MTKTAVVLFSGGIDSILAVKILQNQGFNIEAMSFSSYFTGQNETAREWADKLDIKLITHEMKGDYINLIKNPVHNYGRAMNPCIDCRIYMLRKAKKHMENIGAVCVATGEVIGQRPNSQLGYQLRIIDKESDLEGRLIRPLSAKLLEPTIPENEGIIDREKLFAIHGRSRKEISMIAAQFGITEMPQPSIGCLLTDENFARRLSDLFSHQENYADLDFNLLKIGRHFRLNDKDKLVLGKNSQQNTALQSLIGDNDDYLFIETDNFAGPAAVLCGEPSDDNLKLTINIILRYTKSNKIPDEDLQLKIYRKGNELKTLVLKDYKNDFNAGKYAV